MHPIRKRFQHVQLQDTLLCPVDYVSLKRQKKMIKCNITACGTISRDASMRTTKEDKTFLTFPLRIVIQGKDGRNETVEISVSKEGAQKKVSSYRNGLRVEVAGTLFLKTPGRKALFQPLCRPYRHGKRHRRFHQGRTVIPRQGGQKHRGTERQKG